MTRVLLSFMVAMLCLASSLLAQDSTPPTIICPPNVVLQLTPGECEIVYNYAIFASDNAPGCTPQMAQIDGTGYTSSSSFPIGTTTQTWRATDCSGNQATCSFTITVNEYVPVNNALICDDFLNISIPSTCEMWLTAEAALEGNYGCYDDYIVDVENTGSNYIGYYYVGETITFTVTSTETGNQCWGEALIEDKSGPFISGCSPDTVLCIEDIRPVSEGGVVPDPIFIDCNDFTVQHIDMITQGDCDDDYAQIIMRIWSATDELGYTSTCNQIITVERISLLDVTPICPADEVMECVPGTSANIDPSNTGYPTVVIDGETYEITDGANAVCNLTATYDDVTIPKCGVGFRIIRTWTVLDWCLPVDFIDNPWTCTQVIHYNDTTAPQFNAPANMTVTANLPGCRARPVIPAMNITDCSSYSVAIFTPVGPIAGNGGQIPAPGLPYGTHTITVKVTDACGNSTSKTFTINVTDTTKPNAVCDQFSVVALDNYGYGFAYATTFDNGSTDNCCVDDFQAARMTDNCGIPANLVFDDVVEFCCADVGNNVQVIFRVFDCHGNFNDCMVNVEVQDKSGPTITCPPNVTLNCGQDYTNPTLVGTVETDPSLVGPLDGLAQDNCGDNIIVTQSDAGAVSCGNGTIYRTYAATDPAGAISFCVQTINVVNNNPFTGASIIFPADITLNGCNASTDPSNTGSPSYPPSNGCRTLVSGHQDLPLNSAPDACLKILRTWTVIDWCQYDVNDPASDGIWTHTQVIKVTDSTGPSFASCSNLTFCNFKADCSPLAPNLAVSATDLCTAANLIQYQWTVDLHDDGLADPGYVTNGTGQNTTNEYPIGVHRISYSATDGCGNVSYCNFLFAIEDCKAPTPVCNGGIVVGIMATGMVPVTVNQLISPSTNDNCSDFSDLEISFSPGSLNTDTIFTCDEIGVNPIQVWVTDEDGNADFCETTVTIQDNIGACGGSPLIALNGQIANEGNQGVHNVNVDLNGNMVAQTTTANTGGYQFANLPIGNDYTVTPNYNANPLNGVTTFDLLLINAHILGTQSLDTPYKIIAADANKTGNVTVSDIVEIRKVILHIIPTFQFNTSWRFVDAAYVFPNPANPFAAIFPEVCSINNLTPSMATVNFVAVKIGDVNGSAAANALEVVAEERNTPEVFTFSTLERSFKAGESFTVDFDANLANMLGYQFTLQFDQKVLRFEKLVPSNAMSLENFGLTNIESGILTASWYQLAAPKNGENEKQFSMTFTALQDGKLSQVLNLNSSYTLAESYEKGGKVRPVDLTLKNSLAANAVNGQFELYQNIPNPFTGETIIKFQLPVATNATLTIFNTNGQVVKTVSGEFGKGVHEIKLDRGSLPNTGIYYYTLETPGYVSTKKMTLLN